LIKTIKCWKKQNLHKDTAAPFNIDGLTDYCSYLLNILLNINNCLIMFCKFYDRILKIWLISNLILMYIRLSQIFDTTDCDDGWFGHILLFGDLLPPEDPACLSDEKIHKYLWVLLIYGLLYSMNWQSICVNKETALIVNYYQEFGLVTKSDCNILEKISFKGESFETRLNELCDFINNLPSVCLLPTCVTFCNRIASKKILLIAEDTIDCVPYI